MALSDADQQTLILAQVGDDDSGTVARLLPILWSETDDAPTPRQRRERTKLLAIDVLLGAVRGRVSFRTADGTQVSEAELTANLQAMKGEARAELERLQLSEITDAGGGYASGELAQTAPTAKPSDRTFDANDAAYRGDPYRPPFRTNP